MAKVKIQGNASGTGVLTVTAPNTNSDRTITLPDEDITLGGPFTGGSITSDLSLSDNIKAKFGASDDLQISHDGTHSRIKDTGTGFLVVSGNEIHFNNAANTTNLLVVKDDGRGLSQFTAKAWVNFDGTGSINVRESHNVSSIGDNGVGAYSFNFANTMNNSDYAFSGMGRYTSGDGKALAFVQEGAVGTSYFNFKTTLSGTWTHRDSERSTLTVFGS